MRHDNRPNTLVAQWLSTIWRRLRDPFGGPLSPEDLPDEQRRFRATVVVNTLVPYCAAHLTYACIYLSLGCYYSMSGNIVGLAAALFGYGILRQRRDFVRAALVANLGALAALAIISVSLLSTGDTYLTVLFWLIPVVVGSYAQIGTRRGTIVAVGSLLLILLVAVLKLFAGPTLGFQDTPFPVGSVPYSVFNLFNVVGATAMSGLAAGIVSQNHQSIHQESAEIRKTLQWANERFDKLAEQGRTITWEVDADGLYTYVSHVAEQVLGYGSEELVGKRHFYDLHPLEGRDSFRADAMGVFGRTEPFKDLQNPVVTKDGDTLWMSTNGIPVFDEEGTLLSYRGTDADITERKRNEEILQGRTHQQAALAKFGQLALSETNLDTLFGKAVALVSRVLETKFAKVLEHRPDQGVLFLRAGVGWKEGWVGVKSVPDGAGSQGGYTLLHKQPVIAEDIHDESRFSPPALLTAHNVVGGMTVAISGPDSPFGVLGVHTDRLQHFSDDDVHFLEAVANVLANAVERTRTMEDIRRAETRFRTLYNSTSDAVMLLDEKGFFDCNDATVRVFGCLDKAEFCSKHPADLSPARQPCGTDSMTLANERIATAMQSGSICFEWTHRRLDTGEDFPAEVLLNALTLDGRPVLQASVRDITERKQVEEELSRTLAETERMNRLMSGREDRVIELKREVNALLKELGRDARYGRITV